MNRPFCLGLAPVVALAACAQEPAPAPTPSDTSRQVPVAAPTAPGMTSRPEREGSEAASGSASRYTRFELAACDVLSEVREEGSFADYRCPGLPGLPLLVQEGDGRFDLDAGIDDGGFQTIGAFNDIADTIEWRTRDGAPFAVIFRFIDRAMMNPGRTVLAVEKIGRENTPGCRVAQLSGDTAEVNARARAIADRRVDAFRCGTDEIVVIGEAR